MSQSPPQPVQKTCEALDRGNASAGSHPPLEGYFYQLDVSILMALDLVLAKKVSQTIVLEPASKEDLEADITDAPGAMAGQVRLDTYHLIVQCKLCNSGPWKHESLAKLLAHGTRRESAATRLKDDPQARYLLVTNADVDGRLARNLCVEEVGFWPRKPLPASIAQLVSDPSGRLAVLTGLDTEKLTSRLERLLMRRFKVPQPQVPAARERLRQEAMGRMRGVGGGRWTREELEEVITTHRGLVGDSPDLEGYVRPTNWPRLKRTLAERHALIITGPSGTGKTCAARALIAELRSELPGANVVYVLGGPEKISQEQHRPVIFEIEDPWGQFRLEPGARPWNNAIDSLLRSAAPDCKFVITSRSDVMRESAPTHLRSRSFVVTLEGEHYERRQRAELFLMGLKRVPRHLQTLVKGNYRQAIDVLETPLEMARYFDELIEGPHPEEFEHVYLRRCIDSAHRSSLDRAILETVREREDWRWAAVVWGLFKARERQSFPMLPFIQAGLTQRDRAFEDGLDPYVQFLIAGRHLRQTESVFSCQHPRVLLGLELALAEKPQLCARALGYLVETLASPDTDPEQDWGPEGAVHLVAALRRQGALSCTWSAEAQDALDRWLAQRLAAPGQAFVDDLQLAADVGSSDCVPAELARWLTHTLEWDGIPLEGYWHPPEKPEGWCERIRADPATPRICAAFISRALPNGLDTGLESIEKLYALAPDLTAAFREAALAIAADGHNGRAAAIAYGALKNLDGFEPVLSACLDHRASLDRGEFDESWLAMVNGHYDLSTEELARSGDDAGDTAGVMIAEYVSARRQTSGWTALQNHPRRMELLEDWISSAAYRSKNADEAELLVLADLARGTRWEGDFWEATERCWCEALGPRLIQRLLESTPAEEEEGVRARLVRVFARFAHSSTAELVASLIAKERTASVLALAAHLGTLKETARDDEKEVSAAAAHAIDRVLEALPASLSAAARSLSDPLGQDLRDAAVTDILQRCEVGRDKRLGLARARALASRGVDVSGLIDELLVPRRDSLAEIAISKEILELAIGLRLWPCIERAIEHRFASLRERALRMLVTRTEGPLPASLLGMAGDPSHGVREALLKILEERRHAEHLPALIRLAADTWSAHESPDYPLEFDIARGAAQVLRDMPAFQTHAEELFEIASKSEDRNVAEWLFEVLIKGEHRESQQRVVELALASGRPPYHSLAAKALLIQWAHVPEQMVREVTSERLLRRSARVAVLLTSLIAASAASEQVLATANGLSANPRGRALLVPLYEWSNARADAEREQILQRLPGELAAALRVATQGGERLVRDCLDTLGEVDLTEAIISHCETLFRAKPDSPSAEG